MSRIVKFIARQEEPKRIGYKRVRRRKRVNLEDFGQLNLFSQEAKVISLQAHSSPFEHALQLDEDSNPAAIDFYRQAIEIGDNKADAYCNMGILLSLDNQVQAIDCFTNCLKEDPRHYEAHYNLANIYSETGNLDLAKIHYQMAVQIEPEFASAYYNLGIILAMREEYLTAIDMLMRYKLITDPQDHGNADRLIENLRKTAT